MVFVLESEEVVVPRAMRSNTIESYRLELDEYYVEIAGFAKMQMTEVFQRIAGYTARMSYIRMVIQRLPETRPLIKFRTQELDPFLEECQNQFRLWSRHATMLQHEWEISKVVL